MFEIPDFNLPVIIDYHRVTEMRLLPKPFKSNCRFDSEDMNSCIEKCLSRECFYRPLNSTFHNVCLKAIENTDIDSNCIKRCYRPRCHNIEINVYSRFFTGRSSLYVLNKFKVDKFVSSVKQLPKISVEDLIVALMNIIGIWEFPFSMLLTFHFRYVQV